MTNIGDKLEQKAYSALKKLDRLTFDDPKFIEKHEKYNKIVGNYVDFVNYKYTKNILRNGYD